MRLLSISLLFVTVLSGAQAQDTRDPVPISYVEDRIWVTLPTVAHTTGNDAGTTYNTYAFTRALDKDTGLVLGQGGPEFECDPAALRRYFHMDKNSFLLGEPILVEYRIEMTGPGAWSEGSGGNYRSRGRDDNFYFLLRRADGTWVDDVQPFLGGVGGGLGGGSRADAEHPHSSWQAVQRWCAITEPGDYELYCFYHPMQWPSHSALAEAVKVLLPDDLKASLDVGPYGRLLDKKSREESKTHFVEDDVTRNPTPDNPLITSMPDSIHALLATPAPPIGAPLTGDAYMSGQVLQERQGAIRRANVYARFPIHIETGTPDARSAMIDTWRQAIAPENLSSHGDSLERAAIQAIHYALTPEFLPLIESWITQDENYFQGAGYAHGLASMNDPRATAILLDKDPYLSNYLQGSPKFGSPLSEQARRNLVRNLIALLTDERPSIRNGALKLVRETAGGWYIGDAQAPLPEPSPDQMKTAQFKWIAWLENQPDPLPSFVNGVWGYIDTNGAMAITPQFTFAGQFKDGETEVSQGFAPMHIDTTGRRLSVSPTRLGEGPYPVIKDGKWGYETAEGAMVIPPRYKRANGFRNGRATVTVAEWETVVIDTTGQILFGPERHIQGLNTDGTMNFAASGPTGRRYGLLDRDGHEILPALYENILYSEEDLITVAVRTESGGLAYGFANRTGELVIEPIFSGAMWFTEGRAAVEVGEVGKGLWGYIDESGAMVIEPRFQHVGLFSEGLAYAALQGKKANDMRYGFIDTTGKWVIEPQFQRAENFSDGRAAVLFPSPYRWLDERDLQAKQSASSPPKG